MQLKKYLIPLSSLQQNKNAGLGHCSSTHDTLYNKKNLPEFCLMHKRGTLRWYNFQLSIISLLWQYKYMYLCVALLYHQNDTWHIGIGIPLKMRCFRKKKKNIIKETEKWCDPVPISPRMIYFSLKLIYMNLNQTCISTPNNTFKF